MTARCSAVSLFILLLACPAAADEPVPAKTPADSAGGDPNESISAQDQALLEQAAEEKIIKVVERVTPGSDIVIGEKELERYEQDDIHKALAAAPGVYFREEDGYGLRPNIGMRGSNPERSAKIALMEDGILIAPAPYSAPAAYYFPLITRMRSIEVLKGPGAVIYGPNTVGGSVNLLSHDIPKDLSGEIDLAGGSNLYGKAHGRIGAASDNFGFLVEGAKIRTDGFKKLDGGGDTGFDKNDISLKLRANTDTAGDVYQSAEIKIGYSDETSNETYTGLSRSDFDATPYRRYRATALDKMNWDHLRWQLSHKLEYKSDFDITTTVYRNSFARAWFKLDSFDDAAPSIADVLANPTAGNNPIFYRLLTGETDSTSDAEALVFTNNDREFFSQGIQVIGHTEKRWLGLDHNAQLGLRFHQDQVDRVHTSSRFMVTDGALVRAGTPDQVTRDATGRAAALAAFFQDEAQIGRLTVNAGLRAELIATDWEDRLDPTQSRDDTVTVFIPGAGAYFQLNDSLGVLAGVHRGFVPVAPGPNELVDPEISVNYEAGVRANHWGARGEAIAFLNDYGNLKGTCTVSSGCPSAQVGDEFNGGKVRTVGLETLLATERAVGAGLRVPLRVNYTFTRAEFRTELRSNNPQWGDVMPGFRLPYLPTHQASLQTGVRHKYWELAAAARFQSRVRDIAGRGDDGLSVPAYGSVDLAVHAYLGRWGHAYITVDNVTGANNIVSFRPFGARPGKPRLAVVGYKATF